MQSVCTGRSFPNEGFHLGDSQLSLSPRLGDILNPGKTSALSPGGLLKCERGAGTGNEASVDLSNTVQPVLKVWGSGRSNG
jgi:hypothetical protein